MRIPVGLWNKSTDAYANLYIRDILESKDLANTHYKWDQENGGFENVPKVENLKDANGDDIIEPQSGLPIKDRRKPNRFWLSHFLHDIYPAFNDGKLKGNADFLEFPEAMKELEAITGLEHLGNDIAAEAPEVKEEAPSHNPEFEALYKSSETYLKGVTDVKDLISVWNRKDMTKLLKGHPKVDAAKMVILWDKKLQELSKEHFINTDTYLIEENDLPF